MEKQQNNNLPEGFVDLHEYDPTIITEARYATPYNFVGAVVDGYHKNKVVASREVAEVIKKINKELNGIGYNLVVYDAYRPQKAVDHFVRWAHDQADTKTKRQYYDTIEKNIIVPFGYIDEKCQHSRGCAIDLTIIEIGKPFKKIQEITVTEILLENGKTVLYQNDGTVFMGTHFDYFGDASHHDTPLVSKQALQNRQILRQKMLSHGFQEYYGQWWHYRIDPEPYPETYFDFNID